MTNSPSLLKLKSLPTERKRMIFQPNLTILQPPQFQLWQELGATPRDQAQGLGLFVASLLDIAGTKVAVVQKRAEAKDYVDVDALLRHGIDLPTALAAGRIIYGRSFNPMITLKALSFFDDLPTLSTEVRRRLTAAVEAVDPANLPALMPYVIWMDENGHAP